MESSDAAPRGGWDTYWQGAGDAGAFSIGGVSHPAVAEFWDGLFASLAPLPREASIADIATGGGAVVERLIEVLDPPLDSLTCVDISPAAVEQIKARWPGVDAIVADARDLPLDDSAYRLVTSQFGIEYAGADAILEAARVVADGGTLALLLHIRGGSIEQECRASLEAVRRLGEARFVPLARAYFEAGFAAVRGGPRAAYEEAGERLSPAIAAAEKIMQDYGQGVAAGTVMKLYGDVARIHTRIQHYEPEEVLAWLDRMAVELDAYADRMESMCSAAIDETAFEGVTGELAGRGFTIARAEPLVAEGQPLPLAWALVAGN